MKCLVTGAAGFIGSNLSEALINQGDSVVGIDCFTDYYPKRIKLSNLSALKKKKDFKFVEADLSSARLGPALKGVDCVFHLAAQPGVRASWGKSFSYYVKDNISATQRLLEAAKENEVGRFVYASSSSIYGDSERFPTPETVNPQPVSPYGATKLAAEHLCHVYFRNYGVPTVALRFFTVYGPRQRPDMAFNIFISRILRGEEIRVFGDGEQSRDFTFVADTVSGIMLASKGRSGSVYNVGTGVSTPLNEVIRTIEAVAGKKAIIKHEQVALGDVRKTCADITKITRELRYAPHTPLAEGIRAQVASMRPT